MVCGKAVSGDGPPSLSRHLGGVAQEDEAGTLSEMRLYPLKPHVFPILRAMEKVLGEKTNSAGAPTGWLVVACEYAAI
jgi:hypothetical protein